MNQQLASYLAEKKILVDSAIDVMVPGEQKQPGILHEAIRYSLFAGGKRIRPILAIIGSEIVGGSIQTVMPLAVAIECIHTYSLIHDDLPAMDDDDLRRGKPTAHKVFGEAVAILAGDALLNLAFEIMLTGPAMRTLPTERLLKATGCLAKASGSSGLIAGQVVDMLSEGKKVDSEQIEFIMKNKTASLISASIKSGAILGGGTKEEVELLGLFGEKLGIAFQIRDDVLDYEGRSSDLGKNVGKDEKRGKATFPSILGIDGAKQLMNSEIGSAIDLIEGFGDKALYLKLLALYMGERSK